MKNEDTKRACANPGCERPASPGERYCDTCEVEWLLYRRDLRVKPGTDHGFQRQAD